MCNKRNLKLLKNAILTIVITVMVITALGYVKTKAVPGRGNGNLIRGASGAPGVIVDRLVSTGISGKSISLTGSDFTLGIKTERVSTAAGTSVRYRIEQSNGRLITFCPYVLNTQNILKSQGVEPDIHLAGMPQWGLLFFE